MKKIYLLPLIFIFTAHLEAEEAPPPPAIPSEDVAAELMEESGGAEITIRQDRRGAIEEYRINGQLYMIKITPTRGYPYFLIDTDGDGSLETKRSELDNPETVQWEILRW